MHHVSHTFRRRATPAGAVGAERPSHIRLLGIWLRLGVQSFGGGSATQYLIYRTFVERLGWLSREEFARCWALCQLTPGINLLALTVLIGWRLSGTAGVALSLVGLLLPSVSITVLMTAAYASVRDLPLVQAALRGVVPATVGLGLLMCWRLAAPLLEASRKDGGYSYAMAVALLLGGALCLLLFQPPVVVVLLAAGSVAALDAWRRKRALAGRSA